MPPVTTKPPETPRAPTDDAEHQKWKQDPAAMVLWRAEWVAYGVERRQAELGDTIEKIANLVETNLGSTFSKSSLNEYKRTSNPVDKAIGVARARALAEVLGWEPDAFDRLAAGEAPVDSADGLPLPPDPNQAVLDVVESLVLVVEELTATINAAEANDARRHAELLKRLGKLR